MSAQGPARPPGYADNFAYEPTSTRERSAAIGLAVLMTLATIVVAPFANVGLSAEPTFLLVVESIAVVSLFLTGSTLVSQYRARRYAPLALLGAGFAAYGLAHAYYLAMFPGMFAKFGVFGAGSQAAFWTGVAGRFLFVVMVAFFVYAEWREQRGNGLRRSAVRRIGLGAFGILTGLAIAVVAFHATLPALVEARDRLSPLYVSRIAPLDLAVTSGVLVALVAVCGFRTRVSVWLAVTMLAQILEQGMTGPISGSRFTVGWYCGRVDLAVSSVLFIVAMQMQLAGILQRAARASTRAHTLFRISTEPGTAHDTNARLVEATLLELDFEWGFVTRFEDGHVSIETSVGATQTGRDSRTRLEASLLHGATSREVFVMEDAASRPGDRHARWAAFASVPIFVDGRLYGSAGFASRRRRKNAINDADRDFLYLLGILAGSAIERDRRSRRLTGLAFYDSLTGLPNRAHLIETLNDVVASGERYGTPFALLFLDLDSFKPINDRYGHAVGDEVLREVAMRLRRSVREGDVVARLGGDEFIIVQKLDDGDADARALGDRIVAAFDASIATTAGALTVGVSIGIARYPMDGRDPDALLAAADKAQYEIKHRRRFAKPAFGSRENSRVLPLERRKGVGKP